MSRDELLELAALDAFGLLDEYEAALYTRSFHHAAASVQDEVLELQEQIVADVSMLPVDLPPAELRQKVLSRVAAAVESEASDLAPLASIGRARALVTGRMPEESPGRHRAIVSREFWRASTFVLLAIVAILGYQLFDSTKQTTRIAELALHDINSAQLEQLLGGATVKDYLANAGLEHSALNPTAPDDNSWAAVLRIEGGQRLMLVVEGLRSGPGYELTVTDVGGAVHTVTEFESLGRRGGMEFKLASNIAMGPNVKWEIRREGEVLLASA